MHLLNSLYLQDFLFTLYMFEYYLQIDLQNQFVAKILL